MNPTTYATEGWVWARAARRRFDDAIAPAHGVFEEADRTADLGQALEALDRALRHVKRVTDQVQGTALPDGIDWAHVRHCARLGRDALTHGDERLAAEGFGFRFWREGHQVKVFGRPRGAKKWQTNSVGLSELGSAIDALVDWLDKESAM